MKWSMFLFKSEVQGYIYILSTVNDSLIKVDVPLYNKLDEWRKKHKISDIKCLSEEACDEVITTLKTFIDMGFIVDDDYDEKEWFMKKLVQDWENDDFFCLHILPTTNCNFACEYCYQSGIERGHSLDLKDGNLIIDFLEEYLLHNNKIKRSHIVIHGGEPTLNWNFVKEFLPNFTKLLEKLNIEYHTQIVSNAYLLTEEKADLLEKYNWNRAQFTLDGPESIHNSRRYLKGSKEGTFSTIINNMKYILDNQKLPYIDLRMNYDNNNIQYIPQLLNFLPTIFDVEKLRLSFGLVTSTIKATKASEYAQNAVLEDEEMVKSYLTLYACAKDLGFSLPDFFTFDTMCTAKTKNSIIISSDKKVFKCLSMVGRTDFSIGTVEKNNDQIKTFPNYLFLDLYDYCFQKECMFIPVCHAGCRFDSYLKNGSLHSIDCKYNEMMKINNGIFNLIYK